MLSKDVLNMICSRFDQTEYNDFLTIMHLKRCNKATYRNVQIKAIPHDVSHLMGDEELARYPYLEHLYASGNLRISDNSVHKLVHLKSLNISENMRVTDNAIFQLRHIVHLDISDNQNVSGQEVLSLPLLRSLAIRGNTKISDYHLVQLTQLVSLDVSYNTIITDASVVALHNLTKLICAAPCNISDISVSCLHNLEFLDCSQNIRVTDACFPNLFHLKTLYADSTNIGRGQLCRASKIETLSLTGRVITGSVLMNLPALKRLYISMTGLRTIDITILGQLEYLSSRYNYNIDLSLVRSCMADIVITQ